MFKRIFDRNKLEISIVACGDTGQEIGAEMILALKNHGAIIKSLGITSEMETHHRSDVFTHRVTIDKERDGFAKKLDLGIQAAKDHQKELDNYLSKIIPQEKEGLMLIITGAGATGLGSAMVITELLYTKYKKIPPIVTLLPEAFENSRVQYNISVFLYNMAFKDDIYGNSILLLDNKPSLREMSKPFADVSRNRIETIPTAFADMLFASFEDPVSENYDAKTNDLYEVLHTPGISVFISEQLSGEGTDDIDSSRISDVVADNVIATTSLSRDQIFDAKNAFITLLNVDRDLEELGFQTQVEANKLAKLFQETNPYIKFVSPEDPKFGTVAKLRGIIAGLPIPNRILQIMKLARNSRKRIIIQENALSKAVTPISVDKVENLERKLKNLDQVV